MKLHERIYGVFPSARGGKTDFVVPICMFALFLMGIAFIYSAQSYNIDEIPLARQFWVKQTVFFLFFGLPIYVVLGWTDYKWLFTYSSFIYAGTLLLLIPLALKESFGLPIPFVESRYNATRWIDLGLISIQPSEIAKIGTCIMAASLFARNKITKFKDNFKFWAKLAAVFLIPILLIFLQPDLGSTLVFFPMLFAMLYISKLPKKFFAVVLLYGGVMNPASVLMAQPNPTWEMVATSWALGLPVDVIHGGATAFFLWAGGPALLRILERVKTKYGLEGGQ